MAPVNLPPQARAKWAKTLEARTPEEKLRALQEFLSSIPDHKGSAKLRAHVKHQIAVLRRLIEEQRARRRGGGGPSFAVEKEGAAQVVLLGWPNSGKSSLLRALTNAKPEVSEQPYTTQLPVPGMMEFEDLKFQLVEAPSLRGLERDAATLSLARNADALALVVDLSSDPVAQLASMLEELRDAGIVVGRPKARIEVERQTTGGVRVALMGALLGCSERDVAELLASYGVRHALVKIWGEATLDDVEDALLRKLVYKPAVVVANKLDAPNASEALRKVEEASQGLAVVATSARRGVDAKQLGEAIFKALDVIRVYTKAPGEPPSKEPLVVRRGSTVMDVAERVHKQLARQLKYAKVWSSRLPFSPQRVGASFTLEDGDVVELRA